MNGCWNLKSQQADLDLRRRTACKAGECRARVGRGDSKSDRGAMAAANRRAIPRRRGLGAAQR